MTVISHYRKYFLNFVHEEAFVSPAMPTSWVPALGSGSMIGSMPVRILRNVWQDILSPSSGVVNSYGSLVPILMGTGSCSPVLWFKGVQRCFSQRYYPLIAECSVRTLLFFTNMLFKECVWIDPLPIVIASVAEPEPIFCCSEPPVDSGIF